MISIQCDWDGDLTIGPSGDLGTVLPEQELRYRLLRRLLTNPGGYIWHTEFGAGLGGYVGTPVSQRNIENTILDQIRLEPSILGNPPPVVQVLESIAGAPRTTSVSVRYQVAGLPAVNSLTFNFDGRTT